jgi:catalase
MYSPRHQLYVVELISLQVPERAVHARGAGAHGTFKSYQDWSNITAASFLGSKGKETPVFVRFSTVAGSRGSADTVRDVHGFATRLYDQPPSNHKTITDELKQLYRRGSV